MRRPKWPHWLSDILELEKYAHAWWIRRLEWWRALPLRGIVRRSVRAFYQNIVLLALMFWHGLAQIGNMTVAAFLRRAALVVIAAGVLFAALVLLVVAWPINKIPAHDPISRIVYLDQGPGWEPRISASNRQFYYYTPQGSNIYQLRYNWFVHLERAYSREPFADPQHMRDLGFIVDDTYTPQNPDRMPVGFARRFDPRLHEDVIDITCAACHTGELHFTKPSGERVGIRIDGGQAMHAFKAMTFGSFGPTLLAAMTSTWFNPIKFNRFARNVLGTNYTRDGGSALSREFLKVLYELYRQAYVDNVHGLYPVEEGYGRIDAVGRISNHLFAEELDPKNYHVANAPVSYPPVWNIWKFDWVQYSAEVSQPLARNLGESLGTGATISLTDTYGRPIPKEQRYASTAMVNHLVEIEDRLTSLRPPSWPEDVLGPIDQKKAAAGKLLFASHCAQCHQPCQKSDFDVFVEMPLKRRQDGKNLAHWRITQIPVEEIGTDPQAALNFFNARLDLSKTGISVEEIQRLVARTYDQKQQRIDEYRKTHGLPACAASANNSDMDGINMSSVSIGSGLSFIGMLMREHYFNENTIPPKEQEKLNGFGALDLPQVVLQYKARPLEGIWATAPFLHNGSVPTLYELILPADQRRKTFPMGRKEFDPIRVGVYAQPLSRNTWWFDTTIPGNLNTGHEFRGGYKPWQPSAPPAHGVIGPELTDDQRWAIIEYLKIHKDEPAPPCPDVKTCTTAPGATS
jgi:hypothetical protein